MIEFGEIQLPAEVHQWVLAKIDLQIEENYFEDLLSVNCRAKRLTSPSGFSLSPPPPTPRDPSVKRTICKRCSTLLIPGITAVVRQRGGRRKSVTVRCLACSLTKRFPRNPPGYVLWAERPEAEHQSPAPGGRERSGQTVQEAKTAERPAREDEAKGMEKRN
ncbi:ribonuclease P protein subunit p21 [Hemiscyllium ocellatum]|uniref:ribonuclease P protein subunit p21 n=1 Tax=Hemiscyllium ocellatum TaxID=170820 RepID=UPI0029663D4B|nr:ribonuclease P protein subunit p21 [Hemiscyllium ocellatum]